MQKVVFKPNEAIHSFISGVHVDEGTRCEFGYIADVLLCDEVTLLASFNEDDALLAVECSFDTLGFLFHNYRDILPTAIQCGGVMYPLEYLCKGA